MRRARLLLLDAEIALQEAENNLRLAQADLRTRFRLDVTEARQLLAQFLSVRPPGLIAKSVSSVNAVQAIELQVRQSVHDIEAIDAELWPVLNLNIDSTLFDLGDFESEYEILGRLSLRMPLYDGGSNKARLSEASWRLRELGQDKRRQLQDLENELADLAQQHDDALSLITDLLMRRTSIDERLESLLVLSESADVPRLTIAEAILDRRSAAERLLNTRATLEIIRINNLHLNDELSPTMNMTVGGGTC